MQIFDPVKFQKLDFIDGDAEDWIAFVTLAKSYLINPGTVEEVIEVCNHNSRAASSAHCFNTEQIWLLLADLAKDIGQMEFEHEFGLHKLGDLIWSAVCNMANEVQSHGIA